MKKFRIEVKNNEDEDFRFKSDEERVRQELEKNMQMNAINVDLSREQIEKSQKHYKDIKIKRNILFGLICALIVGILIFGIKKTFFEHQYTGPEIAAMANYYNGKTNFPTAGVEGFLNKNIDVLLKNKLTIGTTVIELNIKNTVVTKINEKSNTLANVYFYSTVSTNNGDQDINCMLPISWDKELSIYAPAGDIIFIPNKSTSSNTEKVENPYLSFDGIEKANSDDMESSQIFVNNFFTMLYSNKNVSPYYKNDKNILEIEEGTTFNFMSGYVLYAGSNKNGYNAYCEISLSLPNGITYLTEKYLIVKPSDESWIITAVL